jgi:hypothetical protein
VAAVTPTNLPKDDPGTARDRGPADGPPRWASVLGIAAAVVVVGLFVVLHLTGVLGAGNH